LGCWAVLVLVPLCPKHDSLVQIVNVCLLLGHVVGWNSC
jgi:hypothetical protein